MSQLKLLQNMVSDLTEKSNNSTDDSKAGSNKADDEFFGTGISEEKEFVTIVSTDTTQMPRRLLKKANAQLHSWHNEALNPMLINNNCDQFQEVQANTRGLIKALLRIPDNYHIFFFQGVATQCFSSICFNLLGDGKDKKANYLVTGKYSAQAKEEAAKHCDPNEVTESKWNVVEGASYFHYTDSEASDGFEFKDFPFEKVPND